MSIVCPLCKSKKVKKIRMIKSSYLISEYFNTFQINISDYLKNTSEIQVCSCMECDYKFYYPMNIEGDTAFYEVLQKNEWYYMSWKYEHSIALDFLRKDIKVLEIGCGEGAFLEKLKFNGVNVIGLELNKKAINIAKEKKIDVREESIQNHAISNKNQYDVVCSFQVLEHIADVNSFINSSIYCLKKGGNMIISVPNNDSFIKHSKDVLNMPPHHLGLWSEKSLSNLPNIFKQLSIVDIIKEPLQSYHKDWYLDILKNMTINKIWGLRTIYYRLINLDFIAKKIIDKFQHKIIGHTIIAIYKKTQ